MDAFDQWQSILTVLLAAVPWMFPDFNTNLKIISILCVFLVSAILYVFRLSKKNKNLTRKCEDIEVKHKALSARFSEKASNVEAYEHTFASLEYLIVCTMQSEKDERLKTLYEGFLIAKSTLPSSGKVDNDGCE